jgi:hypothetical protein
MPKFDAKAKTLEDVAKSLAAIDEHLKELHSFLDQFKWASVEKKPRRPGDPNPGGEEGGSRPPKWP